MQEQESHGVTLPSQQVLTFVLGDGIYGVDILRVREIRGWSSVTRVPHAPPHVLGVLNLRGSIVPVVDLRLRFDLERAAYTAVTVVIVLSVHSQAGRKEVGIVTDGASDVVDIDASAIKPPPDLGANAAAGPIRGLVSIAQSMVVLLDVDRLLGGDEGGISDTPVTDLTAA